MRLIATSFLRLFTAARFRGSRPRGWNDLTGAFVPVRPGCGPDAES
jgi:hypothetical protein